MGDDNGKDDNDSFVYNSYLWLILLQMNSAMKLQLYHVWIIDMVEHQQLLWNTVDTGFI